MRRAWTPEEDAQLRELASLDVREISERMGRSVDSVSGRARTLGLSVSVIGVWTDEATSVLQEMWKSGCSAAEIARRLGLGFSRCAVLGKAHRLSLGRHAASAPPAPRARQFRAQKAPPITRAVQANAPPKPAVPPDLVRPSRAVPARILALLCEPVTIEGLVPGACKFPVAEKDGEHLFCGFEREAEHVYCDAHRRLAYASPRPAGRKIAAAEIGTHRLGQASGSGRSYA